MSENELKKEFDINENKFRLVCKRYGLDYKKAIYYTNVIVVPGRKNDVYVTFDKKCNVIDVRKYNGKLEDMNKYFESVYNAFNDDELSGITICDEYNTMNSKISLGTIFKLTDK